MYSPLGKQTKTQNAFSPGQAVIGSSPLVLTMVLRRAPKPSYQRLSPFLRGFVYGLYLAGTAVKDIADQVVKPDGAHPSQQAIANAIQMCKSNDGMAFEGVAESNGRGAPRKTHSAEPDLEFETGRTNPVVAKT